VRGSLLCSAMKMVDYTMPAPTPRVRVQFGQLAAQRRRLNLSQRQLAAALGVHPMTVYRIEKGLLRPSLDLAFTISTVIGMPLWKLIGPVEAR
jgi:DNA-binding XRE family transcriptional regulator